MRFMITMIPGGYEKAARGKVPDLKSCEVMMKYNFALQRAGVLLALDGLHPPLDQRARFLRGRKTCRHRWTVCRGKRGNRRLLDNRGQVKGRSDRVGERCPGSENEVLEIRPMLEIADFPEDVQKALVAGHTELEEQAAQQAGA